MDKNTFKLFYRTNTNHVKNVLSVLITMEKNKKFIDDVKFYSLTGGELVFMCFNTVDLIQATHAFSVR